MDQVIVVNAGSMVGTSAVTSAFGFLFWWLAARFFSPGAVGLASAAISAMMFLGIVGIMGLGTLIIGELSRQSRNAGSLITTALIIAGSVAGGLGFLFAVVAPTLSPDFRPLGESLGSVLLFAVGVGLTAVTLVLDQALIGLLRGGLQLRRNLVFAGAKLLVLLVVGLWLRDELGLVIYTAWAMGNLISLGDLMGFAVLRRVQMDAWRPQREVLQGLKRIALEHHALNLALEAPGRVLPIIVTALLSASMNASFYVAWMLVGFASVVPSALTTVLYAVGAADLTVLARKIRFTLKLSLLAGIVATVGLIIGADLILRVFGNTYAAQAAWSLRILALGVLPRTVRAHYVTVKRIYGEIRGAAWFMAVSCVFQLVLASIGAHVGGLTGLSLGWLIAICIEALIEIPAMYKAATFVR